MGMPGRGAAAGTDEASFTSTHLLLWGPVPNRPQTSIGPWPGGWGPLPEIVATLPPQEPRPIPYIARPWPVLSLAHSVLLEAYSRLLKC